MFAFIPFVGGLGLPELMIFAVIILLLFGKRLPTVMRSLGRSVVEFKQGTKDAEENSDAPTDDA
jgi:sec-independent protein translocase protein TatA